MRRWRVLAVGVGLIVLVGGMYGVLVQLPQDGAKAAAQSETEWETRIREIGAERAYEEFARSTQSQSEDQQHLLAHRFGGALFDATGVDGVHACDAQFAYGCYHEFLGRALAYLGLDSAPVLNQTCIEMLGKDAAFCQHGVGHGIQAYLGYTGADLQKALTLCNQLKGNDPVGGCSGGIFMEYNFRTMLAREGESRPFNTHAIGAVCNEVPAQNRESCAFWLPQWWHATLGLGTSRAVFTRMGAYCRALARNTGADVLLSSCARGVGNVAAFATQHDAMRADALCDALDDSAAVQACQSQATAANDGMPTR